MNEIDGVLKNIEGTSSIHELDSLRIFYLGKKGVVTKKFFSLKDCKDLEEKQKIGKNLNELRISVNFALENKKKKLLQKQKKQQLDAEIVDVTLPIRPANIGKKHPITKSIDEANSIFLDLGFEEVQGSEIDDEFHIFDALNTPTHHPARQMQDSFYLLNGLMLRPHTSSVQIHVMKNGKPPFKIIAPGRVYRHDSDATHTPMFHQIEGLYIDRGINMSHLKFCVNYFIQEFFGKVELRFRPSFFPFTEPSAEVDIKRDNEWIEILGCGMVHDNVLKNVGVDHNQYQGFAFGIGVERITMLKHNIKDLRLLFENQISWLRTIN